MPLFCQAQAYFQAHFHHPFANKTKNKVVHKDKREMWLFRHVYLTIHARNKYTTQKPRDATKSDYARVPMGYHYM